jgi:F0F1-type ATP synthase membrane subunit b/b'
MYRSSVESGKAQAKAINEQAEKSADAIYSQRTEGARKVSETIILAAIAKARETRAQGTVESGVSRIMGENTREAVRTFLLQQRGK